jgi:hypothetical protein
MDVHDPAKAIEIALDDEEYQKLVIEVADPDGEIAKISAATSS